jgi:hypothetical protein
MLKASKGLPTSSLLNASCFSDFRNAGSTSVSDSRRPHSQYLSSDGSKLNGFPVSEHEIRTDNDLIALRLGYEHVE